jgi:uncharacterized protein YbjT (DUF2867 family)
MQLDGTTVLAFGTAGSQGTGLVDALRARGARPVRVTSDVGRADGWVASGEQVAVADLTDPDGLVAAARTAGAHAAVLHVPLGLGSPDGVAAVVTGVAALRAAGLGVAVNVGGPVPAAGAPDPTGRVPLADALVATGAAVVAPTAYLENHLAPWATSALAGGELVYPRPAEDVIAWIASRDVTAAAVAALALDLTDGLLRLAGPKALTFTELAGEVGAGLGRPVAFREVGAQEYGDMLAPFLGPEAAAGVAGFYASMPRTPDPSLSPDVGDVWQRLGLTPTPVRDWAATTLAPVLPH